jgi:branched-chain amino acid transport system permease protein
MATGFSDRPCGDFRLDYKSDQTIFPTRGTRWAAFMFVILLVASPFVLNVYFLSLMIQIGYFGIGALGLNILVGYSGQISLGHAAFFGLGAFTSCYLSNTFSVPVLLAIPLAGLVVTAVGMIFGAPAARLRGLYLAIGTFAAQVILEDFFARAGWFTGGVAGAFAKPAEIFGYKLNNDRAYFYVVLFYAVILTLYASNLFRSRDGRAILAVRDHYLSAEIMGINLTKYRILPFGISSFYAGIAGGLMAHYLGFVSSESITIFLSIQFLAMIIIGGLGSIKGAWFGTAFIVLLPQLLDAGAHAIRATSWGNIPNLMAGVEFMKEGAVGLVIILFLIFEPEGLARQWRYFKSSFKLYPYSY